jgi:hypothetical protein
MSTFDFPVEGHLYSHLDCPQNSFESFQGMDFLLFYLHQSISPSPHHCKPIESPHKRSELNKTLSSCASSSGLLEFGRCRRNSQDLLAA